MSEPDSRTAWMRCRCRETNALTVLRWSVGGAHALRRDVEGSNDWEWIEENALLW